MKFGLGVSAIVLATQLILPVFAATPPLAATNASAVRVGSARTAGPVTHAVFNNSANNVTAPVQTTALRATPVLIGHCTLWHRAQLQ
jgi:hypothetical protein